MNEKLKKGFKTGLIILGIYVLFILYLLFVSNRVERMEENQNENTVHYSLKIGR